MTKENIIRTLNACLMSIYSQLARDNTEKLKQLTIGMTEVGIQESFDLIQKISQVHKENVELSAECGECSRFLLSLAKENASEDTYADMANENAKIFESYFATMSQLASLDAGDKKAA